MVGGFIHQLFTKRNKKLKKRYYYVEKFNDIRELNRFFYDNDNSDDGFTIVSMTENRNSYYTILYYRLEEPNN